MTITDIPADALPFADDLFSQPPGRPQEERDQWKRRLIEHPYTGEKVPWTAVSTFLGALKDSEGLLKWTARMVVTGLGMNEPLWVRAAGTDPGDTRSLDQIAEEAKRGAGAFAGANLGTAMHGFQDRVDRGEDPRVPSKYATDVEAYIAEMARQGLTPDTRYQERFVLIPKYQLIGRIDGAWWRTSETPVGEGLYVDGAELLLGDRKTKQSRKSWYEEACQLGLYSLATHFYDPETNATEPIAPGLESPHLHDHADAMGVGRPWNMNAGIIIHAPAGTATCTTYWANLKLGRRVAEVAHALRVLRTRKDYVTPMEPLA
jgi:hypothetical protein